MQRAATKITLAVFLFVSMVLVLYSQASTLNITWNAISQLSQISPYTNTAFINGILQLVGFILLFIVLWFVLWIVLILLDEVSEPKSRKTKLAKDTLLQLPIYGGVCVNCSKRIDKDEFKRNNGICDDCWDTAKMKEDGLS